MSGCKEAFEIFPCLRNLKISTPFRKTSSNLNLNQNLTQTFSSL